jgi:5,10-methylenetetrahydromethanopterin reductase
VDVRIGIGLEVSGTTEEIVERARALEATGADSLWASQIFGHDTLSLFAVLGREIPRIEFGSAVIPIQPRHPMMLAAQALTVQDATGGRFCLGIGLSHKMVVEGIWGLSYDKPIRYMREYLSILVPLLEGEQVSFKGELFETSTIGALEIPREKTPPVIVAALGSSMLKLTGQLADGTITWLTGPSTIENHIVPTINEAAAGAGRKAPRVVVCFPVSVTDNRDQVLQSVAKIWALYGGLPSSRAMLDKEGVEGPADLAIVGDEDFVVSEIRRLESIGATDFSGVLVGNKEERDRTAGLLGQLATA